MTNIIASAAKTRTLSSIQSLLTEKNLLERDDQLRTVFHHAAQFKDLKSIPVQYLTYSALSERDQYGDTVLHYAARYGSIGQIELTEKLLSIRDNSSYTVLHAAAYYRSLNQIDKNLLTIENMFENLAGNTSGNSGQNVFDCAKNENLEQLTEIVTVEMLLYQNGHLLNTIFTDKPKQLSLLPVISAELMKNDEKYNDVSSLLRRHNIDFDEYYNDLPHPKLSGLPPMQIEQFVL